MKTAKGSRQAMAKGTGNALNRIIIRKVPGFNGHAFQSIGYVAFPSVHLGGMVVLFKDTDGEARWALDDGNHLRINLVDEWARSNCFSGCVDEEYQMNPEIKMAGKRFRGWWMEVISICRVSG